MNKKMLLTVFALTAFLLATPYIAIVNAKRPTSVLFGVPFATFGGSAEYRESGINWISHGSTYGDLIGDIEGTWTAEAYWIFHDWAGPVEDPFMLEVGAVHGHVLLTIVATVDGKTGTILLRFVDVNSSESVGIWVIYGGTDQLKGLHGRGTWVIPGLVNGVPCQVFEGQIHFDQ